LPSNFDFSTTSAVTPEKAFLDSAEFYRPRRELQKAAPRNFDAFFASKKRQSKFLRCPRKRGFCNARLQQGDPSFAMSQSSGCNKERGTP
jgi:hypothetical protein